MIQALYAHMNKRKKKNFVLHSAWKPVVWTGVGWCGEVERRAVESGRGGQTIYTHMNECKNNKKNP
jgi:hypothetical protein